MSPLAPPCPDPSVAFGKRVLVTGLWGQDSGVTGWGPRATLGGSGVGLGGEGTSRGWGSRASLGASGAETGHTSGPGPAGTSLAPSPLAGASPPPAGPVPPPLGRAPVSVAAAFVGPLVHLDVLCVHGLLPLLVLALVLAVLLPLPWVSARTPPAASDHGPGAGGLG